MITHCLSSVKDSSDLLWQCSTFGYVQNGFSGNLAWTHNLQYMSSFSKLCVCVYICLISVYLCTVDKCIQLFVIYVSTFSYHLYSFCRREEEAYKKLLNQEVVAITARDDSPRVNQYFLTFLLHSPYFLTFLLL